VPRRSRRFKPPGSFDSNDRCNYCHKRGHWKADCHLFKSRAPTFQSKPEGAGLAAPVFTGVEKGKELPLIERLESYLPFIRDG
uniref:CCHC-type domain-containing protein n=1 Tax=Poecilia reticulata TaxID=8081 RepID=A0A3P9PYQ5_POERE